MEPKEKEKQNLTENRTKRNQRQKLIVAILLKFVNKFGHIFRNNLVKLWIVEMAGCVQFHVWRERFLISGWIAKMEI